MCARGHDDRFIFGIVGEKLLLPRSDEPRQRAAGCLGKPICIGCLQILVAAASAEANALERGQAYFLQRLEEQAAFECFIVFKIRVAADAPVADTIENAGGITGNAAKQIAVEIEAEVAVRNEFGGKAAFIEPDIAVG